MTAVYFSSLDCIELLIEKGCSLHISENVITDWSNYENHEENILLNAMNKVNNNTLLFLEKAITNPPLIPYEWWTLEIFRNNMRICVTRFMVLCCEEKRI